MLDRIEELDTVGGAGLCKIHVIGQGNDFWPDGFVRHFADQFCSGGAVDFRHAKIHQNDIVTAGFDHAQCFQAVGRTIDRIVMRIEEAHENLALQFIILDNQNAYLHETLLLGAVGSVAAP